MGVWIYDLRDYACLCRFSYRLKWHGITSRFLNVFKYAGVKDAYNTEHQCSLKTVWQFLSENLSVQKDTETTLFDTSRLF